MTDKENGNEQGDDFESFEEFDINAPHFDDNGLSHDLDGDFESVPDMNDNGDTIDILPDDTSGSDFSFTEDTDFDTDFDEGWEEDNSNFESSGKNDGDYGDSYDKPQRNWLNIAVIGVLAVAVVGGGAMFFMGGNDNVPQQPVIAQNGDNAVMPASAEDNQSLAQQAISGNGDNGMQSLLDNPELLGVTATSNERPDPEAKENEIFQALNNQPVMPDQEVDDIFAALENMQTMHTQQSGRIEDLQQPRPMPQPSDNIGTSNTYDMDFLSNMDSPSVEDEQIAPRGPAIEIEQLAAPAAQMPEMPVAEESLTAALPEMPAEPVTATTTTETETPSTPVAPPVQNAETDKKLDELNERLDQFAARLDSIAIKLDDAAPRPSSDGSSADIAAMETVISRLESKINDLEKQRTSAPAPRAEPKRTVTPAPKRATQQPAQRNVQWDLRGASPDKAYVAERGTQNLRTVSVGDNLPGIGRVTAITQQSGKWVVQGSSGRITQ